MYTSRKPNLPTVISRVDINNKPRISMPPTRAREHAHTPTCTSKCADLSRRYTRCR